LQLLRGCQSADNQFQTLQNQEIEGFSVRGSWLPELKAEVVQIQLLRISLRYLISVDQQDLVLGGFLFLSFWAIFRTFLSMNLITPFTLVLLRH